MNKIPRQNLERAVKEHLFFEKVRVRVRVRLSKIEVRCASACETIIEVRVCVRHTVKFLATQHLISILVANLNSVHRYHITAVTRQYHDYINAP